MAYLDASLMPPTPVATTSGTSPNQPHDVNEPSALPAGFELLD
jgi:hypothetical protein